MSSGALKWSNFQITVNPNELSSNVGVVHDLRYIAKVMMHSHHLWQWLKQYDISNGLRIDFTPAEKFKVETVRARCAIERDGKRNQSHHLHIVLEIGHRTAVQVDIEALKDVFETYLGKRPNVKLDFIKGSGDNLAYILKYITKEVPRSISNKRNLNKLKEVFGGEADIVEEFDANNEDVV